MPDMFMLQIAPELTAHLGSSVQFRRRLEAQLAKNGVTSEIDWGAELDVADRELVLLILAAGATSMMIANAVKTLLTPTLQPVVVTEREVTVKQKPDGTVERTAIETPHVYMPSREPNQTVLKIPLVEFRAGTPDITKTK